MGTQQKKFAGRPVPQLWMCSVEILRLGGGGVNVVRSMGTQHNNNFYKVFLALRETQGVNTSNFPT